MKSTQYGAEYRTWNMRGHLQDSAPHHPPSLQDSNPTDVKLKK